jgi:NADH-quinone oxidoreductase subunit N
MSAYWLEIIVLIGALALLCIEAFAAPKRKTTIAVGAIFPLVFALILTFIAQDFSHLNQELDRFYAWDAQAKFFKSLTLMSGILTLLLAIDYRKILSRFTANPDSDDGTGEYYCLILFACAGMMWMASAKDLVSLFVSLELTTITSYILVGYMRRNVGSLEAGVKFLILGALSTGFLVYGIAWLYGATSTTDLEVMSHALEKANPTYVLFGLSLILISLAFKIGAVPMHLWIPDVYQGAPTPTTAFLSVASKAAGFCVAIRVLEPFLESHLSDSVILILSILAGATILFGNLAAINQRNFKRLLGYSSIANAGFILLALCSWNQGGDGELSSPQVVMFYLAVYLVMTFAGFFVLVTIAKNTGSDDISGFDGLASRNPLLAFLTTVIIGALAGIPLTAGFLGKFLAFSIAITSSHWVPVSLGFIGVAAGFYYYFKIIRAMYWREALDQTPVKISVSSLYTLSVLTALLIVLAFSAEPILWIIGG